jgi:hypothetical protein
LRGWKTSKSRPLFGAENTIGWISVQIYCGKVGRRRGAGLMGWFWAQGRMRSGVRRSSTGMTAMEVTIP